MVKKAEEENAKIKQWDLQVSMTFYLSFWSWRIKSDAIAIYLMAFLRWITLISFFQRDSRNTCLYFKNFILIFLAVHFFIQLCHFWLCNIWEQLWKRFNYRQLANLGNCQVRVRKKNQVSSNYQSKYQCVTEIFLIYSYYESGKSFQNEI